jgi:HEAT repeat protein
MSDIKQLLFDIEPDYDQVVDMGPEVVSVLIDVIRQDNPLLASRATYALGRLAAATESSKFPVSIEKIADGIQAAARSQFDLVRVAAAVATHGLPSHVAAPVQLLLLEDRDIGVRRSVLEALRPDAEPEVAEAIRQWAAVEPDKSVTELALEVLKRLKA